MGPVLIKGLLLGGGVTFAIMLLLRAVGLPRPAYTALVLSYLALVLFAGMDVGFGRDGGGLLVSALLWLMIHLILLFPALAVQRLLART